MTGKKSSRSLLSLRAFAFAVAVLSLGSSDALAQTVEFSFYGVKFGSRKAEIDKIWLPLSGGVYAVSSPAIKQIKPSFDHEGRLYEISFSVDLEYPDYPAGLVRSAFQHALNEKWKKDAGIVVSLAASPAGAQVTVFHERFREGYIRHLQEKLAALLQP